MISLNHIVNASCAPFTSKFRSQQASGDTSISSPAALSSDPETIASTPFFQQLSSQQGGQLLLQSARLHLLGEFSTSVNTSAAIQLLHASADKHGNPDAQFLLGALLAFNDDGNDANGAQSVLYHHFGTRGGSIASSMALGYRHLHGYGVLRSCETALRHYKFAADRVISTQSSVRPVQVFSRPAPFRISDNNSKNQRPPAHAEEDLHRMEYLRQRARGSSDPALLEKAASVVLFSDLPQVVLSTSTFAYEDGGDEQEQLVAARNLEAKALLDRAVGLGSFSAKALLAHVYAYGLGGFRQDVPQAIRLYEEALNESATANETSAEAANGLGLIYFNGVGDTRVDYEKAMRLFKVSARKGHADGVYNTGVLLSEAYPQRAQEYLEASAHVGHLKAQFKLARLKEKARFSATKAQFQQPHAGDTACEEIVRLYKQVAENSREGTELLESAAAAFFFANDWQQALQLYLVAADMGYEVAESNAAWLLERQRSVVLQPTNGWLYEKLVHRGVVQDSPDAHVRYGDLLFAESNFALAMLQYELADYLSYGKHGRALFNMAFMYEKGLGVHSRSLEQASLYYELVASVEPVMLEVVWLLRLKLKVQIHIENLAVKLWSLVNHVCDLVGFPGLHYQESHGDNNEPVPGSALIDQWHETELLSAQSEYQGDQPYQAEAVTFASALRFTEVSKLQLEVLQSTAAPSSFFQLVTMESWIKIQPESSRPRTHMVVLDMQDAYTVELSKAHTTNEDQWLLHFRTESALFVFAKAALAAGEWYHVAIVVAPAQTDDTDSEPTISLFVNGELRQQFEFFPSRYQSQKLPSGPPKILSVGSSLTRSTSSSSQSSQFIGSLMHFRIWTSVKSSALIRELMLTPQHQLDQQQQAELLVELHFEIQRQDADEKSSNGAMTLERTTSDLQSNTLIFAAVGIEPEIVQFPPAHSD